MTSYDKSRYTRKVGDLDVLLAAGETSWAQASKARREARNDAISKAEENRAKFTAKTQPRDFNGRFKKILARLKMNLGDKATEEVAKKIESTEAAQVAGDYEQMKTNSTDLIKMLNDVDEGSLAKGTVKNLRRGATDLGKVMAYLPLPQGQENAKVRFTDVPPATQDLVRSMVKRVEERLDSATAKKYVQVLESYMSGSRTMTSDEMAQELNKLLRVLA